MSKSQIPVVPAQNNLSPSVFLRNLRLLDLDKCPDWPSISPQLFSTKDALKTQKNRIHCVEWALYRLFEIWDPEETRNKLLPFFPPLIPIQSVNLRAAIFKWLNELKKDGILRKDVTIRKTMLDECKGEKLEEVLAAFSIIVLQTFLKADQNIKPSRVRTLALAHTLSSEEQRSLLPLAIAHRASLEGLLRKKARLRTQYRDFQHALDVKEQELRAKTSLELACKDGEKEVSSEEKIHGLRKQFDIHWQGDPRWVDAIFDGEPGAKDPLLDTPFSELWPKVTSGTADNDVPQQQGLLQQLDNRVAAQEARLQKWRRFREDLALNSKPLARVNPPRAVQRPSQGLDLDFSRHTDISLNPADIAQTSQYDQASEPAMVDEYEMLMTSMQKELIKVNETKSLHDHSEDRAFKQGRIESHKLLSPPPKVSTPTKIQPLPQTNLGVADEETNPLRPMAKCSPTHNRPERSLNGVANAFSIVPFDSKSYMYKDRVLSESPSTSSNFKLAQKNRYPGDSISDVDEKVIPAHQIVLSTTSTLSPEKPKPSLSERARKSMALARRDEAFPMSVAESFPKPQSPTRPSADVFTSSSSTDRNSRQSLLERTRRSMSLLPPKPRKPVIDKRRTSKVYPTNQFGSPEPSYNTSNVEAMTPPEALFAQDVNYASVFKSRPKIATSPPPSPMPHGNSGLDNIMEGQVEDERVRDQMRKSSAV
ncbi:hypothetical protein MMC07_006757 [Pseudocyphellaria aurata]|nr:hypothetical protein [Pseudocyphellaria aurata]